MSHQQMRRLSGVFATAAVVTVAAMASSVSAAERDAGDTPKYLALKSRKAAPKDADIDKDVSLDALLQKSGEQDWSTAKAGRIEGYVMQVEREEDGDCHLTLATAANEADSHKWIIVEVTPAVQKTRKAYSVAQLRKLVGKRVDVTGWLYYEPDQVEKDPRGTRWELHPVSSIETLKS